MAAMEKDLLFGVYLDTKCSYQYRTEGVNWAIPEKNLYYYMTQPNPKNKKGSDGIPSSSSSSSGFSSKGDRHRKAIFSDGRQRKTLKVAEMADYHFVYKDVEGTSTQWEDIQRKLGNLPPKPAPFKPAPFAPAEDEDSKPKDKSWIDEKDEDELEELEDDLNLDDDRFLQDYRKKRLAEMREAAKVAKYGSVIQITGSDFVREVSQAQPDVWVVVFLYKESIAECTILGNSLEELAARYPATKFVKIISTECIPNYPDRNLPTLLVYNNGAIKGTYAGSHHFGRRCTPEGTALTLCQSGPVLNDGQSGKSAMDGEKKRFIEKIVAEREEEDDYSSD